MSRTLRSVEDVSDRDWVSDKAEAENLAREKCSVGNGGRDS